MYPRRSPSGLMPVSAAFQLGARDTLRPSFALNRSTVLDTVTIAAKAFSPQMAEFEERRQLGFGHFIARADIEKANATFVADLLRPILSVTIRRIQFGRGQPSRRLRIPGVSRRCPFAAAGKSQRSAVARKSRRNRDLLRAGDHSPAIQDKRRRLRRHPGLDAGRILIALSTSLSARSLRCTRRR